MDKSYYFVLEPGGTDEGPWVLPEIRRRIDAGLVSRDAQLCKVGETHYLPLAHDRYAETLLAPLRQRPAGTEPPPIAQAAELRPESSIVEVEIELPEPGSASHPGTSIGDLPKVAPTVVIARAAAPAMTPIAPAPLPLAPIAPTVVIARPETQPLPAPKPAIPSPAITRALRGPRASSPPPVTSPGIAPPPQMMAPPPPVAAAPWAPMPPAPAPVPPAPMPMTSTGYAPTAAHVAAPPPAAFAPPPNMMAPHAFQQPVAQDVPLPVPPVGSSRFDAPPPAGYGAAPMAPPVPSFEAPAIPGVGPASFAPPIDVPVVAERPVAAQPRRDLTPPVVALSVYAPSETYQMPQAPQMTAPGMAMAQPAHGLSKKMKWGLGGGGVAVALTAVAIIAAKAGHKNSVKDAMVRVTTPSGTGAGFFIEGPDGNAYVATANHVVDRGERVLVERDVGGDKDAFVEAYPETEIVAADPDADLAIIRIKNVDGKRFSHLTLAKEPVKDARVLSYGYPGSSLAKHAGLVSKDGKILSLVSFPAYDERYARVLRENAVDGLLISTDIEPGFSGGPTIDDDNDVVGINVTKDRAHVGQNGAVSVKALQKLLATVKPASQRMEPSNDDVVKLLDKIQTEYLLLPLDERSKVRETDFLSASDLPELRQLVGEVRREERNTDANFISKFHLSGQAALGIYFARLPGKLLETYRAPSTAGPLIACELTNQHLTSFLGDLSSADKRTDDRHQASMDMCDELGVRPLAWDLVAATLQWDGQDKHYAVTKLERMDDEGKIYRASVRISGASNLVDLWLGIEQNQVRLKLFDTTANLYAIKSPRSVASSALQGTWSMKRPRVTDAINKDAEIETAETLAISIDDGGKVSLRHVINEKYFGAGNRRLAFRCNGKSTIETGLVQSFTGTLDNGVVVALPDKPAEPVGADAGACEAEHHADRIVAIKLAATQLQLYRTDGLVYPETIQLTKD